uniref:Uncharacterized protein n=1 Tax=Panagrolaimus sp. JU765 TaxID=591449 RepID=A0AC34R2C4_9BILA
MDITQNFGNSSIKISYDNRRTLLSSHPFHTVYEQFSKNDLPENVSTSFGGNGTITVKIYQNTTMPTIDLNDLEQYQAEELLLNEDRTLRQMLEIILSQNAVDSGNYDVVRRSELYRKHENKIGYGLCTRVGSSKGVRIIETETKKPNGEVMKEIKPALVIDFKKSPFYCSGKFIDLVTEFLNGYRGNEEEAYREAEKVFKNIRLTPIYQKNRVLQFTKFTSQPFSKLE